jgi:hypothetical protein
MSMSPIVGVVSADLVQLQHYISSVSLQPPTNAEKLPPIVEVTFNEQRSYQIVCTLKVSGYFWILPIFSFDLRDRR